MHKKTDKRTAIIDVELLLYAHAAKAESTGTSLKSLIEMMDMAIANVLRSTHATGHYLVVSGRNNFRKVLYDDYKAGRPPKPPLYNPLCEAIEGLNKSRWLYHDQLEADDLISIMATNGRVENPIVCTIDKDMLSVPGWKFNWKKDTWPHYVSQEEADYQWLVQLLMGDSCDNIQGMKGIGEVKAKALAMKAPFGWTPPKAAKLLYESEGFSLDDYYKSLFLISIWRNPMPKELLDNGLIAEIVKTIPSLQNQHN